MLSQLDQSYSQLEVRCEEIKDNIQQLDLDIEEWTKSSFLKEKVARERLLMQKPKEIVYFR
jgi:cell division protein FtsB